ncbi:oxysterol-binding protein-related protein 11 isoform X1 [Neodiprion virginianus]|uniref:oxysterol-binding protein-related protein 11 isoform X1 n=1 Tax=Neodiprion fabricii TaxID=2872261 RepID=UPI001ED95022|nr:oxysterol-binding protein-related protein 11 isoform X1 [Neodiprion fabricii]XP_046625720.1 oxysterol-binding protein-related protein 11 isoform X1 [Neodiprion virginianus]
MNNSIRQPYEGLLHKYTNAMKGWQYRWFILSPETGELHYFLSESEKNQKPRCSIYLAGAVIAPSDEDSNTFIVNSATGHNYFTTAAGDMIKLRATDARARQEWVDKLRAVTEMYTRAIASSHPPLPPREHSANPTRSPVAKLEVLDAFANCREQLNKAEKHNASLAQTIENSELHLEPELLILKAMSHGTLHTLNQCLNILYQ